MGALLLLMLLFANPALASECDQPSWPAAWLFCDDFTTPPTKQRYYQVSDADGGFLWQPESGIDGSAAMVATWQVGQVGAGGLQLLVGGNPLAEPTIGSESQRFRELYYRHYLWLEPGWQGNPHKLSRLTVLTDVNWSQAMIAHLWGGTGGRLAIDPVSCTNSAGQPVCQGYNNFKNMSWLGLHNGVTPIHTADYSGEWHCVEAHVKLNDAGFSNGVQEYWIDGLKEAGVYNLDFVSGYDEYGLNGLFLENWWNGGAPGQRRRVIDNLVVSTEFVGCTRSPEP